MQLRHLLMSSSDCGVLLVMSDGNGASAPVGKGGSGCRQFCSANSGRKFWPSKTAAGWMRGCSLGPLSFPDQHVQHIS